MTEAATPHAVTQSAHVPAISHRRYRLSPGSNVLFVYGTLQFDAVLDALLSRVPQRTPASAPGWRAAALEGRLYPGLVAAPDATATGLLLTDLTNEEWAVLDAFEDDRYDLRELTLSSGGRGWAYVWPDDEVRAENWDAQYFAVHHLHEYAARCGRISATLARGAADTGR
ncbi:gamma-glutamylcyclotransferase family protein [Streptomyces sp. NPDC003077]|uniref:gamma-glutamylcyclotransferase family protein n=1 Tax=Streptomyces sp. NPDC003077 TaxID=3154443 RepID=UPI0033B42264